MKALRNLMLVAVVVGTMTMMGARSFAGPLLPDFPSVWNVGDAVAGQTTLPVEFDGNPSIDPNPLVVDWIVVYLGGNIWGYYYQIENATGTTVSSFTISTAGGPPFFAAGILDTDLDADFTDSLALITIKGHDESNYGNLGSSPPYSPPSETENATSGLQDPITLDLSLEGVTWFFAAPKLMNGYESTILVAYANMPPMYGTASANDSGITWGGGGIPVPSPEPSAVVLMTIGALVGGLLTRRRSRK